MNKKIIIPVSILVVMLAVFAGVRVFSGGKSNQPAPTPTPSAAQQLSADKYPKVSLDFSGDGHYVTVNITNIQAAALEYNLIYDATVKNNPVNTGVTGSAKVDDQEKYTYKQLLGSESSGKFTYHQNIKNAVMELTLRDANRYSIFSTTYSFEVVPGKTVELTASSGGS